MARATIPDDSVLLCEGCGYEIGQISSELCPECAMPIVRSLPSARPGSPWQRDPGLLGWLHTATLTLHHPIRTFEQVHVDPDDSALLWSNAIVAGVLLAVVWPSIQNSVFSPSDPILDFAITVPVAVLLLRILIAVEQRGTIFFARRKGWRIGSQIARAICAHAAIGWVFGGGLALGGWVFGTILEGLFRTTSLGVLRPIVILSPQWMPIAGLLAGMMVFELLSHIGMRRMRFVNLGPEPKEPTQNPETQHDDPA